MPTSTAAPSNTETTVIPSRPLRSLKKELSWPLSATTLLKKELSWPTLHYIYKRILTYKNRSYHDRDSNHGSPAFRADVLTIAPPRLPTLYANFSIYKPLTSFCAIGRPIISRRRRPYRFRFLINLKRRPVYSLCFLFFRPIISRHRRPYYFLFFY